MEKDNFIDTFLNSFGLPSLEIMEARAKDAISKATNLKTLQDARAIFVGRAGEISHALRALAEAPAEKRRDMGQAMQQAKERIELWHAEKREQLEELLRSTEHALQKIKDEPDSWATISRDEEGLECVLDVAQLSADKPINLSQASVYIENGKLHIKFPYAQKRQSIPIRVE